MNERKAVTRETRGEYHKAGKKEKGLILDQYVRLTGYNRKYAIRVLSSPPAKTTTLVIDGKTVVFKVEKDTREELDALNRVYRFLCPLANFFIPGKKLLRKTRIGSTTVKIYDKALKTPYQRLMGSSLTEQEKAGLSARRALLNPVELQYNLNQAIDTLLAVHTAKVTFSKCPTQKGFGYVLKCLVTAYLCVSSVHKWVILQMPLSM